jgi:uncharacterized phage protein (TIGR02220 family)
MLNIDSRIIDGGLQEMGVDAFAVLMCIANHANKDRVAWPGTDRLRKMTGLSRERLYAGIAKLVELRYLERGQDNRGNFGMIKYRLLTDQVQTYAGQQVKDEQPHTDIPYDGKPCYGNPDYGKPCDAKPYHLSISNKGSISNIEVLDIEKKDIMSDSANADDVTPAKAKKKKNAGGSLQPTISEVVAYLNAATGQNMKDDSIRVRPIAARLKDKVSVDVLKAVIDLKTNEWKGTHMAKYLRPETLFNPTKFATYVDELAAAEKKRGTTSDPEHAAFNAMVEKEYPNVWSSGIRMMNEAEWKDYKENITLEGLKIWMRGDKEKVMQKFLKHISKNWELRDKYDNLFSAFRYEIKNRDKW